jgi:hypothetical protein
MMKVIDFIFVITFLIIGFYFLIKGYPETIGAFIGGGF